MRSTSVPPEGLALANGDVTWQAAALAYLQDFRLMMWVTMSALPRTLLLRKAKHPLAAAPE